MRLKVLDAMCGGGGASMGYLQAGLLPFGVDIVQQPNYPFRFVQADAFEFIADHAHEFDLIHASPVCKRYSSITRTAGTQDEHPDQIAALRSLLQSTGKPYVIENVSKAPLRADLMLCGTMFGLRVIRHRYFECNPPIFFSPSPCQHLLKVVKHGRRPDRETQYAAISGHFSDVEYGQQAMGIDWLGQEDLSQAIPPAYTEYIGHQFISRLV